MRTIQVMSAVTTDVSSAIQSIIGIANDFMVVQVIGTGTYSVVIEGSFDGVTFFTLDTMAADEIAKVTACPYMRATTSGTSGSIRNALLLSTTSVPAAAAAGA